MRGRLLLASPSLEDPNFVRTVILLLAYGPDEGALGIILNRPSEADVGDVLPQWHDLAAEPTRVFRGGPVSVRAVICLAMPQPGVPSMTRAAGVEYAVAGLVSVDLERDPAQVADAVAGIRLFAGYAGWSAGQLEAEMEAGGWILTDPLPGELLTDDPEGMWAAILSRLGGLRKAYVNAPPKLSMN